MSASFTSGPWGVVGQSGFTLVGAGHSATEKRNGWVAQLNDDQLGCEANANLIAAAPDLYATLSALVEAADGHDPYTWSGEPIVETAKIVLAKARGETA